MAKPILNGDDLDAWQTERKLDGIRAPARHAVAAWSLAATLAMAAALAPSAIRHMSAGIVELRHEVLMLDREFDRMSVRLEPGSVIR